MPTNASLTVNLLKDAAAFYKKVAAQNPQTRQKMSETAAIYEGVAELLGREPAGISKGGDSFAALAGKLMRDTAIFYRKLADQNEPLRELMEHNAAIYDQFAEAVTTDPLGHIDE
jgi:hypothetical protein